MREPISQVSGSKSESEDVRQQRVYMREILWIAASGRLSGGGDEIRTHETFNSLPAFQASAFNHSATPPQTQSYFCGKRCHSNPNAHTLQVTKSALITVIYCLVHGQNVAQARPVATVLKLR